MENRDYLARGSLSKPRRSARRIRVAAVWSPEAPPPETGVTAAGAEFAEIPAGSRPRSVRVRRRCGADVVDARAAMDEPARARIAAFGILISFDLTTAAWCR